MPSMKCSLPTPCELIQPQAIKLPQPCFTVGTRFLASYSSFGRRQTYCLPSEPKRLILVSSDHNIWSQKLTGFITWSLAKDNLAVLCPACSRGFLRGQRPCRLCFCSVRLTVCHQTTIFKGLCKFSCTCFRMILDFPNQGTSCTWGHFSRMPCLS